MFYRMIVLGVFVYGLLSCALMGTSALTVLEAFVGDTIVLPCTKVGNNTQIIWEYQWTYGQIPVLKKTGENVRAYRTFSDRVSVEGEANLRISLEYDNDEGNYTCKMAGADDQVVTVQILARLEDAVFQLYNRNPFQTTDRLPRQVALLSDIERNIDCEGIPRKKHTILPHVSQVWTIDDDPVEIWVGGYSETESTHHTYITLDKTMDGKTLKCMLTNRYGNGSVLSTAEVTTSLYILYLDAPVVEESVVTVTEGEDVTLRCICGGNPAPRFVWSKSGTIRSSSPDYTMTKVQKSAAGVYTCQVINSEGRNETSVTLIVNLKGTSEATVAFGSVAVVLIGVISAAVILFN